MGKRGIITKVGIVFFAAILFLINVEVALAANTTQPVGPDSLIQFNSTTLIDNIAPSSLEAQAGNVSFIAITDTRSTEAWQGYYGNVSGTITLDDSANNTFFDWAIPNPSGEVYAANRSNPGWLDMFCINVSQVDNGSGAPGDHISRPDSAGVPTYASSVNSSLLEKSYGINESDKDGLNETFTAFLGHQIEVGPRAFDSASGCSMAQPYINDNPGAGWEEIILSDNGSLVFTALLRDDETGFDGQAVDFQMLVLEDGHAENALTTTTYYFFVELS